MPVARKTLVILSPGFPADDSDSTCLPDRQIFVRVLQQTYPHIDIVVIAFQYPFKKDNYRCNGVRVIALGGKNKNGLFRRLTWLRAWRHLKTLKRHTEIIGLLSFWLDECAFIGAQFAQRNHLKHYTWLLGQDARPGNNYVYRIAPYAQNLIALSDFLADQFERNYRVRPAHIIPGAIAADTFASYNGIRDIDMLGVGSLIPLKRYDVFIDVIAKVKVYHPQVKAMICGKGPDLKKLLTRMARLKLEDNIILAGELPHHDVLRLMQRAKVFLHPSKYEGFSTVCLEAIAAGAHVLSIVQPMHHDIEHWTIAANADELAQNTISLLSDEGLDHNPVIPYRVEDTTRLLMQLYV